MSTEEFILSNREADVACAALSLRQYPEVDAAFALQQIEGWQRSRRKLPTAAATEGWRWGTKLSIEQCSSEETARYKRRILKDNIQATHATGVDLTGGLGVDSFFLSEGFSEWHYVEQNEDLCETARHNFGLTHKNIQVHCCTAEHFLSTCEKRHFDLIFVDPARRNATGGKVFRLEDCTPDLTKLYHTLMERTRTLMLKLSPMLDMQQALRSLPDAKEMHVVATEGEVKEVLAVCRRSDEELTFTAVDLNKDGTTRMVFLPREEQEAQCDYACELREGDIVCEPDAAVLKAGAFKLTAARFGLQKADKNTHLYIAAADNVPERFPGRMWKAEHIVDKKMRKELAGRKINVLCRNYPLRADELKKQWRLQDGGDEWLVCMRLNGKPIAVKCNRI